MPEVTTNSRQDNVDLASLGIGVCVGAFFGGLLTALITLQGCEPQVDRARIFRQEGKPAIMRLYKTGNNGYLIEDREDRYIPLKEAQLDMTREYKERTKENQ